MQDFKGVKFAGTKAVSNHINPQYVRVLFCRMVEDWLHVIYVRRMRSYNPDLFGEEDDGENEWLSSKDFAWWCDTLGLELDFAVKMITYDRQCIEQSADKEHGF